jgi:hypothetical protein
MMDLKTYENILVSGVPFNFSRNLHENIPPRLLFDWATLVCQIAKVVHPAFPILLIPQSFEFKTESISSDGPYGSSENYYTLDYVSFQLTGENGCGFTIAFENGRQDGENPVWIETLGFNYSVSSYIYQNSAAPLAKFFVWTDEQQKVEIDEIFTRHQSLCFSDLWSRSQ